ncbi:hypothetical protein ACXET9_03565 [Brachybacterium sp. DNPG3]
MRIRPALCTALAAGTVLVLSGCGGSYDDSRDVYEEMRVKIGCDTVDSSDFTSYMEGEVTDDFPAFDTVEGYCQLGDDEVSVAAVVPHDVKGKEFLEAMNAEGFEGYAVQSGGWVVLIDGTDREDYSFAEAVQDELGGTAMRSTESGVEKI